jgi:DNA-binding NarL/FixJ family response regulator
LSICKLHIAIIEPSHIVYEGIVNILLNSGVHYHVYRLESIDEIKNQQTIQPFDVIILNPSYISNSIKKFESLKKEFPLTHWIGISYAFFEKELLEIFQTIIQITDSPKVILDAIEDISKDDNKQKTNQEKELLSDREIQVLEQLVHGLSNKEIADKLHISTHTVISHRKNITQKTGIKSQSGLTIYAISNRIISLEGF